METQVRLQRQVFRLRKLNRFFAQMDYEAAKRRIIEAANMHGICDCPPCLARIVEESKANWPHCAAEVGK